MIRLPIPRERIETSGPLGRILGLSSKNRAFAEAKNLVLSGSFTPEEVEAIAAKHGDGFLVDHAAEWKALLEEVLFHLAGDGKFDDEERAFVKAYVQTFRIPREAAESSYRKAVTRAFLAQVAERLDDGKLDAFETDQLSDIARRLGISERDRHAAFAQAAGVRVRHAVDDIMSNGLVSDDEYAQLRVLLTNLGVELSTRDEVELALDLARDRWRILNAEVRSTEAGDLELDSGERVYFRGRAEWRGPRAGEPKVSYEPFYGMTRLNHDLRFDAASLAAPAPAIERDATEGELVMSGRRAVLLPSSGRRTDVYWANVVRANILSHHRFQLETDGDLHPIVTIRGATFGHPLLAPFLVPRLMSGV